MSGWSNMTVHPPSGLSSDAEENAKERIQEYLENDFDLGPFDDPADGYGVRNVQLGDKRRTSDIGLKGIANETFKDCPAAGRIVIIVAGDTSDSGGYWYFERQDGETALVDKWHGYQGANGRDAEGRIKEKHGVSGYASCEA